MHKRRIAFIVEGENREQMIFHNLYACPKAEKRTVHGYNRSA